MGDSSGLPVGFSPMRGLAIICDRGDCQGGSGPWAQALACCGSYSVMVPVLIENGSFRAYHLSHASLPLQAGVHFD